MAATVAVLGATGVQGGSVCQQLLQNPNYIVRAITRNPYSDKAQTLAAKGCEVAQGDVNDQASLVDAFQGADAIFSVTSYWESLPTLGRHGAGSEEATQQQNIARAALETPTLRHYILSSVPPASRISDDRLPIPHFDYKADVAEDLAANFPSLARLTTRIWPGFYASNLAYFPMCKFLPVKNSGTYIFLQSCRRDALLPIGGDVGHNIGLVVEAVLAAGAKRAGGKVIPMVTDYVPMEEVCTIWSKVTGVPATYAEVPDEVSEAMWGSYGAEMASQYRWSEKHPRWDRFLPEEVLSLEMLGIREQMVGFEEALRPLKELLV